MNWQQDLHLSGLALLAALLGGMIGWDREKRGHEAGIRTHATVALGSCLFSLISAQAGVSGDRTRIAAQIVTGIGFLGAGVIIHAQGKARGLTTAATLWTVAAVGMAVGFERPVLGAACTFLLLALLQAHRLPFWPGRKHPDEDLPPK